MRKLLALSLGALCAVSLAAGVANAKDLSWAGAYAGVQGGVEWAKASGPFTDAGGANSTPYSNSPNGGLLGARVGYNWQKNNLVFGVEADANAVIGAKASAFVPAPPTSYVVQSKQTWTSDVRARLGYAIDKTLLYAAAGVAFGDVHTAYGGAGYSTPFAVTTQRVGWTVGAGAEYALSEKIVASFEYRYTDLGSKSFSNSSASINTADNVKYTSNTVLVGLAYKF